METILQHINGKNTTGIIYGLVNITDLVKNGQPLSDEANTIFKCLIPKLNHNHYKIRGMAYALVEYLFIKNFRELENPIDALPSLIFGLQSVNKMIVRSAKISIRIITQNLPLKSWWKEIEKTLETTKSKECESKLLKILAQLDCELPAKPFIHNLQNPDKKIRERTQMILYHNTRNEVLTELSKSKVNYTLYRSVCDYLDNKQSIMDKITERRSTKIKQKDESKNMNERQKFLVIEPKMLDSNEISENMSPSFGMLSSMPSMNFRSDSMTDNQKIKEKHDHRSIGDVFDEQTRKNTLMNANKYTNSSEKSNFDDFKESESEKLQQISDAIAESDHSRRSKQSKASMKSKQSKQSEADNISVKSNISEVLQQQSDNGSVRSHMSLRELNSETNLSNASKSKHSAANSDASSVSSTKSFNSNAEKRSVRSIISEKENNPNSIQKIESETKPRTRIGKISQKQVKKMPVELRNLSECTWLERLTFLGVLSDAIDDGSYRNYSGDELLECALSGSLPLHRKVVESSMDVIAKIVLLFPESLNLNNLNIIVKLVLSVTKDFSDKKSYSDLMEVITQEANLSMAIEAAIDAELPRKRPLFSPHFVLRLLKAKQSEVKNLSVKAVEDLLSFFIRETPMSNETEEILSIACLNHHGTAVRFYRRQTNQVQSILRRFIPRTTTTQTHSIKRTMEEFVMPQNLSKREIMEIFAKECKKGDNANFNALNVLLDNIEIDELKEMHRLFYSFLILYSRISDQFFDEMRESLFDIASKHFCSMHVLDIIKIPKFDISLIDPLAKFAWNCPSNVFDGADSLYEDFYRLFCENDGNYRRSIVSICIAIEKKTGVAFTDLKSIKQIHKRLISTLAEQFIVE